MRPRKGLIGAQAVVSGFSIAIFDALHQPGLPNLNVFVPDSIP